MKARFNMTMGEIYKAREKTSLKRKQKYTTTQQDRDIHGIDLVYTTDTPREHAECCRRFNRTFN